MSAAGRATFRIWRGEGAEGRFVDYSTPVSEGMVVLDAVHRIQAELHREPDGSGRINARPPKADLRELVLPTERIRLALRLAD